MSQSVRELITLGTSSQVPTRFRNHNGYLLRFSDRDMLLDPGEGTQRQLAKADLSADRIRLILVTHFHGDHSLGLAGMMMRICREGSDGPVHVVFPGSGLPFFERMLEACIYERTVEFVPVPIEHQGLIFDDDRFKIWARRLSHSVETFGYRIEEQGEDGQVVAHVMDTRRCRNAVWLADNADLLISECTYMSSEEKEAKERGHMTARHAAQVARDAGARRLILTHFSQRYTRSKPFAQEARAVFDDVRVARDLARFPFGPGAEALEELRRRARSSRESVRAEPRLHG
ncbi:MAG: ribonuclease Z [Myxococcota bacterium]